RVVNGRRGPAGGGVTGTRTPALLRPPPPARSAGGGSARDLATAVHQDRSGSARQPAPDPRPPLGQLALSRLLPARLRPPAPAAPDDPLSDRISRRQLDRQNGGKGVVRAEPGKTVPRARGHRRATRIHGQE